MLSEPGKVSREATLADLRLRREPVLAFERLLRAHVVMRRLERRALM